MSDTANRSSDETSSPDEDGIRRELRRQAASIALAVAPFGIVFGVACAEAGLSPLVALGYSVFVFTGSAQFAAVDVLGDDGTVAAAVTAGVLLNLRSLAFGMVMAPALAGPWWKRAAMSQLMIDESTAVGTTRSELRWRRYGYLVAGLAVFVVWNLTTLVGVSAVSSSGDLIERTGLDAAGPAVFLALVWPRLADATQRRVALVGAVVALALVPVAPPGVPIVAAVVGVAAAKVAR
ncbi:MAG: AzlC family ABC transporter permease [Actinomycetota bacterium]